MSYHYHMASELVRDHALYQLESDTQMPLRLSLLGLACCADRAGRFLWRPAELKQQALPYERVDFEKVMRFLNQKGFLLRHTYDGVEYGVIASPLKKTRQEAQNP